MRKYKYFSKPIESQNEKPTNVQDKWAGFRGLKWDTSIADAPGMVLVKDENAARNLAACGTVKPTGTDDAGGGRHADLVQIG